MQIHFQWRSLYKDTFSMNWFLSQIKIRKYYVTWICPIIRKIQFDFILTLTLCCLFLLSRIDMIRFVYLLCKSCSDRSTCLDRTWWKKVHAGVSPRETKLLFGDTRPAFETSSSDYRVSINWYWRHDARPVPILYI